MNSVILDKTIRVLVADNHEDGMLKCRGELIDELVKMSQVYISVPRGKYTQELMNKGCIFEELDISRRGTNPIKELILINSYRNLLKRVRPDIVLTYSIKPNVYLGFLCGIMNIPYIANVTGLGSSIQDGGVISKLTGILYKIGLRKANMVFCQNKTNQSYLLEHGIICGPNILIPGSGVNLNKHPYEEYPDETNEISFLTIGRIMKDKGTDELLEAARIVKKKYFNVSFSMIGFFDGDYEGIIEQAEKDGIVSYHGHQDDVHSFIKDCHAVVHPSYHEGMANALLEGAATGRPVIATCVSGCIETFDPGVSGFSCRPKDSVDLANAIIRFIELPHEDKVKMGIAGRRKMELEFDRKMIIEQYMNEIKKILRRSI